ncbi:hypothetical protein [Haloglycomyces albus]|uniref:hypothetical protein n=1 Tax=Haloglycomyces albus TaxID=526067 RepID=UPI0012EC1A78|nr:hypothetical protein [Haloglycomyces albus]
MSEQQAGAGYPQQPAQSGYPGQPYSAPQQAGYPTQQAPYPYQAQGPNAFDKLGVPMLPAILALSAFGALILTGLLAGTSDDISTPYGFLGTGIGGVLSGSLFTLIILVGLALFTPKKYLRLWQFLSVAIAALFLGRFLFNLITDKPEMDASFYLSAFLLLISYGLLATAAILVPSDEQKANAAPGVPQGGMQQAQAAQQQMGQPMQQQQQQWQQQQPPQQ